MMLLAVTSCLGKQRCQEPLFTLGSFKGKTNAAQQAVQADTANRRSLVFHVVPNGMSFVHPGGWRCGLTVALGTLTQRRSEQC